VKTVTHEDVTSEALGGADVHGGTSGVAHFVHDSEMACIAEIRRLVGFIPGNNVDSPPARKATDPADRREEELLTIIPDNPNKPYDMHGIISRVVDDGELLEVHKDFATT